MDTEKQVLVNRVAESSLITINLENFFPDVEFATFDVKDFLFMELILKEKEFREALKAYDWAALKDKVLLLYCSNDAIIPTWAFMLVTVNATPYVKEIFQGKGEEYYKNYMSKALDKIDFSQYDQQRIVIKGCGNKPIPVSAYIDITNKLQPFAQSIMYGEPCSTVPIFKKPRVINK